MDFAASSARLSALADDTSGLPRNCGESLKARRSRRENSKPGRVDVADWVSPASIS
jgi:hypothetical protein